MISKVVARTCLREHLLAIGINLSSESQKVSFISASRLIKNIPINDVLTRNHYSMFVVSCLIKFTAM